MENTEQSLEKTDDNYKVPNLEKGIAVIEYLSSRSEGETLQAIKVALDISQTTAYRILNTLVRLDYLSFDEDTKRYKLTRKLLTLGFRSLNEHNLLETVLPHLRDLRDRVKETERPSWAEVTSSLTGCMASKPIQMPSGVLSGAFTSMSVNPYSVSTSVTLILSALSGGRSGRSLGIGSEDASNHTSCLLYTSPSPRD